MRNEYSALKRYSDRMMAAENKKDAMYPNRHVTIHKAPCKNCPSIHSEDDEVKDIKANMSKAEIVNETLFVCGWRNSKLCKGYCDYMGIDENIIKELKKTTP